MKKKLLITGSNGLLGQKLVHLITSKGEFEIIATSRGENRISALTGFIYEPMDITSQDSVNQVFDKHQPDYVIHGAAMTNVDQCETEMAACVTLNITGTENVVKACEKHNSFLCHVSTDFIFDGEEGPYDEEGIPNPISFYGDSKLKAEEIVQNSTLKWGIARTILVYGITEGMSRSNIILWVKGSLEQGKELNLVTDQLRSPTLAEDLAMGCYLICEKEAQGVFNVSGPEILTPYEMAIRTAEYFNLDKSLIHKTDGSKFQQTAPRPPKTGFIIDKAKKELGYQPHTFEEGISIMLTQMENN